jgi:hypothetical protein
MATMNYLQKTVLFHLFLFFSIAAYSQVVDDKGNFFQKEEVEKLTGQMMEINQATTAQILVYTTPDLGDADPRQFSLNLFNELGIGQRGVNNGVLIMISKKERSVVIMSGNGVQWILSDEVCAGIIGEITPFFRKQEFYNGIHAALNSIHKLLSRYSWEVKSTGLNKISASDEGKILEFRFTNKTGKSKYAYGLETDPQFSEDFKITIQEGAASFLIYYTKYMNEEIAAILNRKNIKVYVRLTDWENKKMELFGVINE